MSKMAKQMLSEYMPVLEGVDLPGNRTRGSGYMRKCVDILKNLEVSSHVPCAELEIFR